MLYSHRSAAYRFCCSSFWDQFFVLSFCLKQNENGFYCSLWIRLIWNQIIFRLCANSNECSRISMLLISNLEMNFESDGLSNLKVSHLNSLKVSTREQPIRMAFWECHRLWQPSYNQIVTTCRFTSEHRTVRFAHSKNSQIEKAPSIVSSLWMASRSLWIIRIVRMIRIVSLPLIINIWIVWFNHCI